MNLELKCPYPVENTMCVHYNIPVYYALQLLCQMKVKNMQKCWYVSYSSDSVVVLELKFQDEIWEKMFGKMKELYDKESIPIPKRKVQYRDEYRGLLKEYLQNNTSLVAEVPSIQCESGERSKELTDGPYTVPEQNDIGCDTSYSVHSRLHLLISSCKTLINEAYELERK